MGLFDALGSFISGLFKPTEQQKLTTLNTPQQDPNKWWKGESPTFSETLGQILRITVEDPDVGTKLQSDLSYLMTDSTSEFYNPFANPTNPAIANLQAMGIDVGTVDDNWFKQNEWAKGVFQTTGTTNNVKAPTKKSSPEEIFAYQYNQLWKAEETTKKAEQESKALQEELGYWANRADRNYSDDEILKKIDWNKYPTLQQMQKSRDAGTPIELNRAVPGWNEDWMRGVIWASRNEGGTGNIYQDMAWGALGMGNVWQENPEITAKLNAENLDTYSPYSVGSTLEKEGLYFGVDAFNQKWLDDHRYYVNGSETDQRMYANVVKAEEKTVELETALQKMHDDIDAMLKYTTDPQTIINTIKDTSDYNGLFELDKSLKLGPQGLVGTTRAIDYRWQDIENEIYQKCEKEKPKESAAATANDTANKLTGGEQPPVSSTDEAVDEVARERIQDAGDMIRRKGTDAEKGIFGYVKSTLFQKAVGILDSIIPNQYASLTDYGDNLLKNSSQKFLGNLRVTDGYEEKQADLLRLQEELNTSVFNNELITLEARQKAVDASGMEGLAAYDINTLNILSEDPSLKETLEKDPTNQQALAQIYFKMHDGQSILDGDLEANFAEAQKWADLLVQGVPEVQNPLTDNEQARLKELTEWKKDLESRISMTQGFLNDNKEAYDKAKAEQNKLAHDYEVGNFLANVTGSENFGPQFLGQMSVAYQIAKQYQPTQWLAYSVYDSAVSSGKMTLDAARKEAKKAASDYAAEAGVLTELLNKMDRLQVPLSSDERRNIERQIADDQRQAVSASYFLLDDEEDFTSLSAKTRSMVLKGDVQYRNQRIIKALATGQYERTLGDAFSASSISGESRTQQEILKNNEFLNVMTDEDKARFFYLLGKEGEEAAMAYWNNLTDDQFGILTTRVDQAKQEQMQKYASQNLGTGAVATGLSFLLNITGGIDAAVYELGQKILGREVNPHSRYFEGQTLTNAAREGTREALHTSFGDNDMVDILYDAFTSGVDSAINAGITSVALSGVGAVVESTKWGAKLAGWVDAALKGEKGAVTKFAVKAGSDLAHASTMGMNAATGAYREALLNGGTPEQATKMALATFFAETATEAITVGNIKGAFEKGTSQEAIAKNLKGLLLDLVKNGGEEALGEGLNEWVESKADELIMGELSSYEQNAQKYIDMGFPRTTAYRMADQDVWRNVVKAAATGFVSSGLSTTAGYVSGRISGDQTTEQTVNQPTEQAAITEDIVNPAPEVEAESLETPEVQEEAPAITKEDVKQTLKDLNSLLTEEGSNEKETMAAATTLVKNLGTESARQTIEALLAVDPEVKHDLIYASMTEGTGNAILTDIVTRLQNGESITAQDAANLRMGVEGDRTGPYRDRYAEQMKLTLWEAQSGLNVNNKKDASLIRDLTLLYNAQSNPNSSAETLASVLSSGSTNSTEEATAAGITMMQNSDADTTLRTVTGLLFANPTESVQTKNDVAFASLTQGVGNEVLKGIMTKIRNGEKLTAQDVMDLRMAVEGDQSGSRADKYMDQFRMAVREVRLGQKVQEKLADGRAEALEAAKKEVAQKKQNLETAEQNLETAQEEAKTVGENLKSVESEYNPAVPETAAPLQQTANQMVGALNNVEEQKKSVEGAQKNVDEAQKKLDTEENNLLTQARQEAEAELEEERAQEEATLQQNQALYQPTVPFRRVENAVTKSGQKVQLTGVYAMTEDNAIYTTPNGYISETELEGRRSRDTLRVLDNWRRNANPVTPYVILSHSLKATVDSTGDTVDIIGIAGQNDGNTVLVDAKGDTYSYDDLTMQADPFTGEDGDQSFFDMTEDVDYDNMPEVPVEHHNPTIQALWKPVKYDRLADWLAMRRQAPQATGNAATQQQQQKAPENSPVQIVKNLIKKLGVGEYVGTRKFGELSSRVRAYFETRAKYIAVRNADVGDYTTTLHEVGHAVADKYDLQPTPEMMANFQRLAPEFFDPRTGYSPAELPGEAMAEFMWRYMESEARARQFAGDAFYDTFERAIRGTEDAAAIAEAREQLQQWINAPVNEQIRATIKDRSDRKRIPLRQRIREAIDSIVDNTSTAEDFDKAIRAMESGDLDAFDSVRSMALWANTAGKQAYSILAGAGLTDALGERIGPSLAERLSSVGFRATGENLDLLTEYMLALHSLDRDAQGKPVFDRHVTPEARVRFIEDIQRNHPEIAAAEAQFQAFRTEFLQEFMVNTGRLTQEAFDKMNDMYPHYVPTFRVKSTDSIAQRTGKGKTYQVQRASGSTEDIYNPLDSFFGMVNTIVSQNALNRAALTFDRMYQTHKGLGAFAHEVIQKNPDHATENQDMSEKQRQAAALVGGMLDADTLDQLMEIIGNRGFNQNSVASHDTLKVVRPDGTIVEYQFEDMELFKLLAGINDKHSNAALDALGFITRGMSALTTGSNPIFALRNFMRDFQNSVNYGSWASNYGTGVLKWLRSAWEVFRESDNYKDYEALGGGGWTRIDPARKASRDELYSGVFEGYETANAGRTAKWLGKKIWNALTLARLNEIVEQTSRFAEYRFGKHDLNTQEGRVGGYLAAQEATVDFNRSGNSGLATMLKKLVPFFNASMQGVYRTARMGTEAERSRLPQRFFKTVVNTALMSALSAGLMMKFMDDDDKKEFEMLSDDLKSKHFYLPNFAKGILGEAPLIRIPLPQDPLTYAVHGAVTNALWSGQTEDPLMIDLAAIANTILDNLNPIGSGTVLAPILAINSNTSWYGSPIVPSHLQRNKNEEDQYTEETPDIFKAAGRVLGMSPMKIQYLAEQYTGFLGQLAIPALSTENGELGGLNAAINAARKRFTSDPLISNDVVSRFYDNADLLNSVIEETNQGKPLNVLRRGLTQDEAGQAYEDAKSLTNGLIKSTKETINGLYNEIDEINANKTLSDKDKYQLTSEKRREMIEAVTTANEKLAEFTEKYVNGTNIVTRMLLPGSDSYKPTEAEKLPETFREDMDQNYMKMSMSVFDNKDSKGYQKQAALPHPDKSFTLTTRFGEEIECEIPDEEWGNYMDLYKDTYSSYLYRKGANWDSMTDKQQYDLLKAAHAAANKEVREMYARMNGILLKK